MPGAAVRGRDRAGGVQQDQAHDWFVLESKGSDQGDPIVTIGDRVAPHGDAPHSPAPVMVEGEPWFVVGDSPVSRAEHAASCGHKTTGRYWFQLEAKASPFRQYRFAPGDRCSIEHIPWIMRALGWHVGAKLMDNWFERPASRDRTGDPDYTTVTMDFILAYEDAFSAYRDLIAPANWTVPNGENGSTALQRLCNHLRTAGKFTTRPTTFDDFGIRPHLVKAMGLQIDSRKVRDEYNPLVDPPKPPLDGLTAALGQFELFLVASGDVEPLGDGRHKVTIRRTGVFAEDSYDFEGVSVGPVQIRLVPLGDWNPDNHTVDYLFGDGCIATDGDFNLWRERTIAAGDGRGGDIMIYTEFCIDNLQTPFEFTCAG